MKKIITLLAIAAMSAFIMISCSGNGSSKGPFGSLPEQYEQFQQEKEQLEDEAENITTEAEKAKLMEKYNKMQEKWKAKIEESSKALDGKAITLAENEAITVTEPISFQYDGFYSESKLEPRFKINGKAEIAADIAGRRIGIYYTDPTESVFLVGYNAEGTEVYKIKVGFVNAENREGNAFVPAGTPVNFDSFGFSLSAQSCKDAQTLKLEIR